MAGIWDKLGESLKGLGDTVSKGQEAAMLSAEKHLRVKRLKLNINELREEKDRAMSQLSHTIYERYINGTLQDAELLKACQAIKMLQMQIDERWTEVNSINGDGQ